MNARIERRAPQLMALPTILILLVVSLIPLIYVLVLAFTKSSMTKPLQEFVGFGNFRAAFHDEVLGISLVNTLVFALSTTILETLLGFGLALALQKERRISKVFRTLALLPLFTPPVGVAMIWRLIYNPNSGMINHYLMKLGFSHHLIAFLGDKDLSLPSIILADVWQWTPFCFLLLLAALQSLPREPFEAAAVDGTTPWQVFRKLTLPMVAPALIVVFLFRMIIAFKVFDLVFMLTMGGPGNSTQVASFYIYKVGFKMFNTGYGAALSLLILLLITLFTTPLTVGRDWFLKRIGQD